MGKPMMYEHSIHRVEKDSQSPRPTKSALSLIRVSHFACMMTVFFLCRVITLWWETKGLLSQEDRSKE